MRLLNVNTSSLDVFFYQRLPPYAILSHTWRRDQDETSSLEVGEAINSMFRWYTNAAICYAFLRNVPQGNTNPRGPGSRFALSRWFTRGWTLQEILAPQRLSFYNAGWELLGTKGGLGTLVEEITGIPSTFLLSVQNLGCASVPQRMCWAAKRETKREEDRAYCLLGIFGVTMPMIYGEGGDKAFERLQEHIMKGSKDDSILAWGIKSQELTQPHNSAETGSGGRVFASSPLDFMDCQDIASVRRSASSIASHASEMFSGFLQLQIALATTVAGETFGLLDCHHPSDPDLVVGIPLVEIPTTEAVDEYVRPRGRNSQLLYKSSFGSLPTKLIQVRDEKEIVNSKVRTSLWIENFAEKVELFEVEPASGWDKQNAIIEIDNGPIMICIRFRPKQEGSVDFILMLHGEASGTSVKEVQGSLMIASPGTTLEEIAQNFPRFGGRVVGHDKANNGELSLHLDVEVKTSQLIAFKISETLLPTNLQSTVNATKELHYLEVERKINELDAKMNRLAEEKAQLASILDERDQPRNMVAAPSYDTASNGPGDSDEPLDIISISDSSVVGTSDTESIAPHSEEQETVFAVTETRQSRYSLRNGRVLTSATHEARSFTAVEARRSRGKVNKYRKSSLGRGETASSKRIRLLEMGVLVLPDEFNEFPQEVLTFCRHCPELVLDQKPYYTWDGKYIQRRRKCRSRQCMIKFDGRCKQYQQYMDAVEEEDLESIRQQEAEREALTMLKA